MNDMLPDDDNSKASVCVEKAFAIYEEEKENKGAQLIFCDLSTPKHDGNFNVYEDIKQKLVDKGVPEKEIAFIHDANTETKKADLFAKVRSGDVRFLLGSTQKMGAGTNVQDRLIALHHLDVPWRPSDIEQQEGRIIRQGNMYKELNKPVKIFRYVTEGTFDSYSWQVIENKQKFIGQIMTSKSPVRSCDDVDEAALTYAEVKALCTGNPYIKEKMDLDIQVSKLKLLKANHTSQIYRMEDNITKTYPKEIARLTESIKGYKSDIAMFSEKKEGLKTRAALEDKQESLGLDKETSGGDASKDGKAKEEKEPFEMKVGNKVYTEKKEAGAALIEMCRSMKALSAPLDVGEYMGFKMTVSFEPFQRKFDLNLKGAISHHTDIGSDPVGNITRMNNVLAGMDGKLEKCEEKLANVEAQLEIAKVEVTKPFEKEQELSEKLERLSALNALLNMDESGDNKEEDVDRDTESEELTEESARENSVDEVVSDKAVSDKPQITGIYDDRSSVETQHQMGMNKSIFDRISAKKDTIEAQSKSADIKPQIRNKGQEI
jgi:hypothetical protein